MACVSPSSMASQFPLLRNSICRPKPSIYTHPSPLLIQSQHCSPQTSAPDPKFIVNGGSKLSGHVTISGSKNSALPILAATLCCSGTSKLHNIPDLSDIRTMASILASLGVHIELHDGEMLVGVDGILSVKPSADAVGRIRGGFLVIGPLLSRFGEAVVSLPGGCEIGARPVDLYIRGLRALGAIVELRDGEVRAQAANGRGLVGGSFKLDYPSVGATETLMMAACVADGVTVLSNAAQEPEVIDLACFLNNSGACVEGAGSDKIFIRGRRQLDGSVWNIMPDRIEAGTFMIAAAITRSCVSISRVVPGHLSCLIDKLSAAGCTITQCAHDTLELSAISVRHGDDLRGFDVKTRPFPGFPTDLQPQTMALLATCNGLSIVEESVFDNRLNHVRELHKLGSRIQVFGSSAFVFGKGKRSAFCGSHVIANDIRGGASLVLAGLAAEGITEITGVAHIDRGYENLELKLQCLGADVKRSIPVSSSL